MTVLSIYSLKFGYSNPRKCESYDQSKEAWGYSIPIFTTERLETCLNLLDAKGLKLNP